MLARAALTGPYGAAAPELHRAGWRGVVPITGKNRPLTGYTGAKGRDTSYADVHTWVGDPETAGLNVCLRPPPDVIGLDVDAYDGRNGGRTLAEMEHECGPLPPTFTTTSRTDGTGSGIRLFHVPGAELLDWPANLDGLTTQVPSHFDIIRRGHRYAVVSPSIHPRTGQEYRWYGPDGQVLDGVPKPDELAELPAAHVAWITGGQLAGDPRQGGAEPRRLLAVEDERPTDRTGPIPAGGRDQEMYSHACSLRAQGIPRKLADRLQERRWQDCEQPPGDRFPLDQALAKVVAAYSRYEPGRVLVEDEPAAAAADEAPRRNAPLDWTEVLDGEQPEPDWYAEPVLEAGTSVVVYSPPKAGKSLLLLDICAGLAAGRSVLGKAAREPVRVLYLDMENTLADLGERLRAMGYAPADLGDRLIYISFPSLRGLDTAPGGKALHALVHEHRAAVVVIDTLSRFVEGDENEAQTYADLYRHSLAGLKRAGVSVVRLDHAGKDVGKGQRGSSAKSADVDAVWRLAAGPGGTVDLVREVSRNGHGAERVRLSRLRDPLRHVPASSLRSGGLLSVGDDLDPRVRNVVKALDDAEVPLDYGRERARALLSVPVANALLSAALDARRRLAEAAEPFGDGPS